MFPPVTTPLHSSGYAEIGKEERHGRFKEIILWNNIRRLVLKVIESENIDAHAGPLTIVAFSAAVPTVISRGMLWDSAQQAPERWGMLVWTGVPSRESAVKESKKGHANKPD